MNGFRLTSTGLVNYWWGNDLSVTADLVGGWHHVAATHDGTTRRILVDGIVVGSDSTSGHSATTDTFSIGAANESVCSTERWMRCASGTSVAIRYKSGRRCAVN